MVPYFRKKDGSFTKHTEGLIQVSSLLLSRKSLKRHVVPAISLGYKFVATATNQMNAIKCAQFYSSIDKFVCFINYEKLTYTDC